MGCFEDDYQITAVAYGNDGNVVYTGGIDNMVTAWDVRQMHKSMSMKGHTGEGFWNAQGGEETIPTLFLPTHIFMIFFATL